MHDLNYSAKFFPLGLSPELRRLISWMMDSLPQQRSVAFLWIILMLFCGEKYWRDMPLHFNACRLYFGTLIYW